MLSQVAALAEQIKIDLVAASAANYFELPLTTVERRWYLPRRVANLPAGQHLTIAHADDEGQPAMQSGPFERTLTLQLRLLSKLSGTVATDEPLCDKLDLVREQIADYYCNRVPTGRHETLIDAESLSLYGQDDLENLAAYTAVMQLTFFGWRPL